MGMAKVQIKGGDEFQKILDEQKRRGTTSIAAGVLGGNYPDGESVAGVGEAIEFGLASRSETPWFRKAMVDVERTLKTPQYRQLIKRGVSLRVAQTIASAVVDKLRESIEREGLVDTGRLKNSIASQIMAGKFERD